MGYGNISSRGSSELLAISHCIYWMLVVLICNTLNNCKESIQYYFFCYNVSLLISCLNFGKIRRFVSDIWGQTSRSWFLNVQDMQGHTKLLSASCQRWVSILSLNSKDVLVWWKNFDFVPFCKFSHAQGNGRKDIKRYKNSCAAWMFQSMGWDGKA